MDNKKIKTIIIILLIIIAIVTILIILTNRKYQKPEELLGGKSKTEESMTISDRIEQYDFLVVNDCVTSYISGINKNSSRYYGRDENNEYKLVVDTEQINKNAYELLSTKYVQENSITIENVYEFLPDVTQELLFIPLDMKGINGENANSYQVYGYTTDLDYNFYDYLYVIVNIDKENNTFSIEPINKTIYENDEIQCEDSKIDINDNNEIFTLEISEDYKIKQYFRNYKLMLLSNPEIAYNFLNEDYKEKSFGSIENFKKYINNNKEKIISANLNAYKMIEHEDYMEYIERDETEHYYIFNISDSNPVEFNVMLDSYIVGSSEYQTEYEERDNQKKVALNAMKFIYAINDKNFYYIYNNLDERFKQNKFETLEKFEEYIKNNLFEHIYIGEEYNVKEKDNIYIYQTEIKDRNDHNAQTKTLTIIMQLKEGKDFVMSFSLE